MGKGTNENAGKVVDTTILSIELSKLEMNEGQLEGLPANPREILESKYELLKQNIQQYPEFLKYNMLKVYPLENGNYIIIGGNMRYRAMKELGFKTAPCIIYQKGTSFERLKAYVALDNISFGRWEWSMLANEWETEALQGWGIDLPIMESEINVDEFFDNIDKAAEKDKGEKITVSLPDEYADQKDEIKTLIEAALAEYEGIKIK